ncbi:MAG: type II secretion system secretin GspD [Gammaproteobacteria bacterium]
MLHRTLLLLALAGALAGAGDATPPPAAPITLNLQNADIQALIDTVAKVTGRNFVVDPRVKGNVTVISAAPTSSDELYEVFLSILRVHGYVVVPAGKVDKIVPDAVATQNASPVGTGGVRGDELVTQVFGVEHVPVGELVPILRPLLPQSALLTGYAASNVLVASDTARNIGRLGRIIERIDRANRQDIEIINLVNADATDLVRNLVSLAPDAAAQLPARGVTMSPDPRTNSIVLNGKAPERLRYRAIIAALDNPVDRRSGVEVVYLRYANAEDLVAILEGVAKKTDEAGTGAAQAPAARAVGMAATPQVQADPSTNSIIIQAPPARAEELKRVIASLDIRRAQVYVEAVIAELSNDARVELGVQWRTNVPDDGTFVGSAQPGDQAGNITDFGVSPLQLAQGLTFGYLRSGDLRALLRALGTDRGANVLSTPTLVTLDNEEAEIVVGQNVPFITGQFTTNAATTPGNPFQTINRQDIGILLRVKPQINEGDAVKLDIRQEVSTISRDTTASDLITNKRAISTSVLVDDGQVLVLGGLMSDDLKENVDKVPFLGDVPLLGHLFRTRANQYTKTNLMVFLRPTILRDSRSASALSTLKYEAIRERQSQAPAAVPLMPGEERPRLPPIAPAPAAGSAEGSVAVEPAGEAADKAAP